MIQPDAAPILLVEDDPNDVALIQRAFRKARLANPVHVANDGAAAQAYLSGNGAHGNATEGGSVDEYASPALVLLDLKLPGRSGHEVLRWIRSKPELAKIPVVVLTSSRENADIERAYALGANSYLRKPATFERLLEMVDALNLYWMVLNVRPSDD